MAPSATPDVPDPTVRRPRRRITPAHEVRARRRTLVGWLLFGASAVLMANALFGDSGYLATIRARRDHEAALATLQRIRAENQDLRGRIQRVRDDPAALEELARSRHGLIKPGETLVIVKEPPAPKPDRN